MLSRSHLHLFPFSFSQSLASHPNSNSNAKCISQHPKSRLLSINSKPHHPKSIDETDLMVKPEYKPSFFDDLFLNLFRKKMVEEINWDSDKPGYDGLIEVARHLMIGRTNSETSEAAVRILRSLFPPMLLELYRMLITPIGGGRLAAIMVARVTAFTCEWLMGPCRVNNVSLPDGSSCGSGVLVERCKYLEESKCVGICVNTCKRPTQTFFKEYMGIPLLMEPNFNDYSCQFNFGVPPTHPENDSAFKESCFETCPSKGWHRDHAENNIAKPCPKLQIY